MESRRSRAGLLRGMCVCALASIAALALAAAPASASASAASPVLEFVVPGHVFPTSFTADGGEVTAAMTDFDTVVHCTDSEGEGVILGPRHTLSHYAFTGCETQGGSAGGHECQSAGASAEEIKTGTIEADLVYIDQAKHEVAMLLNPHGGVYMEFECGGESVKAIGSFLSPVDPINKEATSFTAILRRSGAAQTPSEYENESGEKLKAIPTGERNGHPVANTGVELSFTVHPSASLEIKAVNTAEVEAKQRDEEAAKAAAAKKHQEEEAAAKKRQEDEATVLAAKKHQEEAEAKARKRHLTKALNQCKKVKPGQKRARCMKRAHRKFGGHEGNQKPQTLINRRLISSI